jgi:DnaJ-class molecular chaperone
MLEEDEVFCPKCKGTGKGKSWMAGEFIITPECSHCLGEGKLDWLERIVGKPPRKYKDIQAAVIGTIAEEIANEIDKEILEGIYQGAKDEQLEQNIKGKEGKNDNRVFS